MTSNSADDITLTLISIHILAQRMTAANRYGDVLLDISIHILAQRMTLSACRELAGAYISIHILA